MGRGIWELGGNLGQKRDEQKMSLKKMSLKKTQKK